MPAYTSVSSCALLIWPFLTVSCHRKHTRACHIPRNRSLVVIQERKGVSNRENRLRKIAEQVSGNHCFTPLR